MNIAALFAESSEDGLVALDAGGRIVWWNTGAHALFGYSATEVTGRRLDDLIVPADRRAEADQLMRAALSGETATIETRRVHKDATLLLLAVTVTRAHATGDATLVFVTHRKLSDPGRARDVFARRAHELRTPLNAIIGFADLLVRGKIGPLSPQQQEHLGDILTSARKMLATVEDITGKG